jgi:hypothetical protein
MTGSPEETPFEPETPVLPAETDAHAILLPESWPAESLPPETELDPSPASPFPASVDTQLERADTEPPQAEPPPLFQSWSLPEVIPPERIPHLGHLCLLGVLTFFGLLAATLLTRSALYFHLFGVSTAQQALNDIHYSLGSQAMLYLFTLLGCMVIFPLMWHKGYFAGLQWNGGAAWRMRKRLLVAALICFVLAIINGVLLPGPSDTPIDKIFRAPGAAWLLFGFGVTFAPFFEEMVFRGFLLPALCTACDWIADRAYGKPVRPLGENGHPQWSLIAMSIASVLTSIAFSLMHAEQTSHALGPFLLLICVSLVLCWARLSNRSLASSVLVHASYNFMLFVLMLLGTGGFRHLENM